MDTGTRTVWEMFATKIQIDLFTNQWKHRLSTVTAINEFRNRNRMGFLQQFNGYNVEKCRLKWNWREKMI